MEGTLSVHFFKKTICFLVCYLRRFSFHLSPSLKKKNPQLSKAFDIISSLGCTECSVCRFSAVVLPASSPDHFKSSGILEIRKRKQGNLPPTLYLFPSRKLTVSVCNRESQLWWSWWSQSTDICKLTGLNIFYIYIFKKLLLISLKCPKERREMP